MSNMTKRNSYRILRFTLAAASLVLLTSSLCPATGTLVFECDFEGEPVPEISGAGQIVDTQGYSEHGLGNLFLQNATGGGPENGEPGEPTLLTLTNLPFHTHVEIRMDLAIINSWDGSNLTWGPDYFNVIVDDQSVFRETFSNIEGFPQSFVPAADEVVVKCDVLFDDPDWNCDALYAMGPSLQNIPHTGSEIVIAFYADGDGWQAGPDESWAIDNIQIFLVIDALVVIKPETLNLNSKGLFTAFIDLPEGCDEEDIDTTTIVCEGAPAVNATMADDGRLVVKFDREDLGTVPVGDAVELTVTGELSNGTPFAGSDTIRVIDKGGKK